MTRTNKATKQTAAACYAERHAECADLLKRIASRLEQHKKDQEKQPATGATQATWTTSATNSLTSLPASATAARSMPRDWNINPNL